jgi:hypothetical protein
MSPSSWYDADMSLYREAGACRAVHVSQRMTSHMHLLIHDITCTSKVAVTKVTW